MALALILAVGWSAKVARAATFVVANTNNYGLGSLRDAIGNAGNSRDNNSTITFDATVFAQPQTITLQGTEMAISQNLTIVGPSAGLTLDADKKSRIFHIGSDSTANISGLTLTGGTGTSFEGISNHNGSGGAVFVGRKGTLILTNSTIRDNSAMPKLDGGGAGICNFGGVVTLVNTTVSGNVTSGNGGGIWNQHDGKMTLLNCDVSGNRVESFFGGGIDNEDSATMTLTNCTVSDNKTGAIGIGGGIANNGDLTLRSCTIANNSGDQTGGVSHGFYNGVASLTLSNTLLANNTGGNLYSDGGPVTSQGYNLSSDDASAYLKQTGDQNKVAAGLDPKGLKDNGGPTRTIALLSNSPAINTGDPAFDVAKIPFDQRGKSHARIVGNRVDIGAYELSPLP